MIDQPLLMFSMQLDETPQLNIGRLFLIDRDKPRVASWWQASSGVSAWQGVGDWSHQGGGCIPPSYKLSGGVDHYQVSTTAVWQSLSGIDTNTYKIDPLSVTTKDNVERSELLIHRSRYSAPMSGSLGCIVLPEGEFDDFEKVFNDQCGHLTNVPLLVGYTFD